jgi:hypothetical protein
MLNRLASVSFLSALLVAPVFGDTTIVFDDFESYADDTAMHAVWVPTGSLAQNPFLFDFNTSGQPFTDITPPDPGSVDGKAVFFDGTSGGIAQYANAFSISPSATQNIVLSGDLAHDMQNSNKRLTLGLRNTNADNIIELGFYNGFPAGPNGEFFQFGYRAVNIPGSGANAENNGWFKSSLPENKDQLFEIGQKGFHTFEATISLTDITIRIDLFGDGINNGTGEPGWDAIDVNPGVVTAAGFNNLRFGGPSGVTSASPFLGIDNISLRLVDIVSPPGDNADFNNDGIVDGRDFLIWQRGFGISDGTALLADGDANDDGNVDGLDLPIWQNQYGNTSPLAAIGAVPEPSSALLLLAMSTLLVTKRR